jgi:hypothetical protein
MSFRVETERHFYRRRISCPLGKVKRQFNPRPAVIVNFPPRLTQRFVRQGIC